MFTNRGLRQAKFALKFVQRQLVELSNECETAKQNELVFPLFFVDLQDKLEKVLHEVRVSFSDSKKHTHPLVYSEYFLYLVDSFITEIVSLLCV